MPKKLARVVSTIRISNVKNQATSSDIKQAKPTPSPIEIKKDNWYMFTFSFLSLADIGCSNLLVSKANDWDRSLVLSIIFNLKHALEVVMKTISNHIYDEFEPGHNVQELFRNLKNKKTKTKKNAAEINAHLDELEKVLTKYRQLNLFQSALKNAVIFDDKNNKLFKYPDNNKDGGIVLEVNYSALINKLTKSDIRDIKEDIRKIKENLNKIKSIIKD